MEKSNKIYFGPKVDPETISEIETGEEHGEGNSHQELFNHLKL
jgi:hypothetical protein